MKTKEEIFECMDELIDSHISKNKLTTSYFIVTQPISFILESDEYKGVKIHTTDECSTEGIIAITDSPIEACELIKLGKQISK